jgi:hypothetical protein
VENKKIDGLPEGVYGDMTGAHGDLTGVRGDLTCVWGDLSGMRGDMTGVYGDLTGVLGDIDLCAITDDDRKRKVDIDDLIVIDGGEE